MTRFRLRSCFAIAAVALAELVLLTAGAASTFGHSELVSSSPADGQVLDTSPAEIRLAFSEAIEPRYSSLDLFDERGAALVRGSGRVEADGRTLVAPVPPLAVGTYIVQWRTLSAADGHVTNGSLTFSVGAGQAGYGAPGAGPGGPSTTPSEPSHSASAHNTLLSRTAAYVGEMLAFGLWVFGWLVVRPVQRRIAPGLTVGQALALAVGAAGAAFLLVGSLGEIGSAAQPSAATGPATSDLPTFVANSRVGLLLAARVSLAGFVAPVVYLLGRRRPELASHVGGLAAAILLILTALMSHAAAATSVTPLLADVAHLAAASIWFSGLVALTFVSDFGTASGVKGPDLGAIFWRFSAIALVSVGLIAATGIYAAWTNTHDFTAIVSLYSLDLFLKVALVVGAFLLGGINYLRSGPELRTDPSPSRMITLSWRVLLEATLAFSAVVLTADLTGGSPPASGRPVAIAPEAGSGPGVVGVSFAIQPGRPGPNELWVVVTPPPIEGAGVKVELQRLDGADGTQELPLSPSPSTVGLPTGSTHATGGVILDPGSRWRAAVAVSSGMGDEIGQFPFVFALGETGLVEGREAEPVDPGLLAGLLLLVASAVAAAYWIRGGRLPLAEPWLGRRAMGVGAILGAAVGLLIVLAGGSG